MDSPTRHQPRFFYGYVIVLAGFFILLAMEGTLYTFGIFLEPLSREFGWSRAETSGAYALLTGLHGLLYIVTGRLTDRLGPRKIITAGGIILGSGYILTSYIDSIWQLYLSLGIVVAMGQSCGYVPLQSTVARWFHGQRGLMTGIVIAGIGAGTVVMPLAASRLIAVYDWRTAYRIIAVIVAAVLVIGAQFLKRDPSEAGLKPYPLRKKDPAGWKTAAQNGIAWREAVRTRSFLMLAVMLFGFGFTQVSLMTHVVAGAIDAGVPALVAANILAFVGGVSTAGRIGMGSASDRLGYRNSIVLSFVFMVAAMSLLVFAREFWTFALAASLFGFGYGAFMAVLSPAVAELFGLKSHGAILGTFTFIVTSGGAVGPLLTGRLFDITGSYFVAFTVCGILLVVGLVLAVLLRQERTGSPEPA